LYSPVTLVARDIQHRLVVTQLCVEAILSAGHGVQVGRPHLVVEDPELVDGPVVGVEQHNVHFVRGRAVPVRPTQTMIGVAVVFTGAAAVHGGGRQGGWTASRPGTNVEERQASSPAAHAHSAARAGSATRFLILASMISRGLSIDLSSGEGGRGRRSVAGGVLTVYFYNEAQKHRVPTDPVVSFCPMHGQGLCFQMTVGRSRKALTLGLQVAFIARYSSFQSRFVNDPN
jgi:hypothetical protein